MMLKTNIHQTCKAYCVFGAKNYCQPTWDFLKTYFRLNFRGCRCSWIFFQVVHWFNWSWINSRYRYMKVCGRYVYSEIRKLSSYDNIHGINSKICWMKLTDVKWKKNYNLAYWISDWLRIRITNWNSEFIDEVSINDFRSLSFVWLDLRSLSW